MRTNVRANDRTRAKQMLFGGRRARERQRLRPIYWKSEGSSSGDGGGGKRLHHRRRSTASDPRHSWLNNRYVVPARHVRRRRRRGGRDDRCVFAVVVPIGNGVFRLTKDTKTLRSLQLFRKYQLFFFFFIIMLHTPDYKPDQNDYKFLTPLNNRV